MTVAKVSKAYPKTTNWHIAAHAFDTIKTCKTDVREHTQYIWFPLCIPHFSLSSPDFLLSLHSFFLFSGSPLSLFLPYFLPQFFFSGSHSHSFFLFFFSGSPSHSFFLFFFWFFFLSFSFCFFFSLTGSSSFLPSVFFHSVCFPFFFLPFLSFFGSSLTPSFFLFGSFFFFLPPFFFFLALLLPSPLPNSLPSLFLSFFFLFFFSAFCYHFNSTPQYPFFGSPQKTATSMF